MARQGDMRRPRGVKAEFDEGWVATARGGAVLIEQAIRRLGLRRALREELGDGPGLYGPALVAEQLIAGLLGGGRGFQATEIFAGDRELARLFGFGPVASGATVYRAVCAMAGLGQRRREDVYTEAGPHLASLDIFGRPLRVPQLRRLVPAEPEAMSEERGGVLRALLSRTAVRLGKSLRAADLRLFGFVPVFGDGTDLEVRGRCFDAARRNHKGDFCLRAVTVMAGPLLLGLSVLPGNSDEGRALPAVLGRSAKAVKELAGKRPVLALLDAAFAEREIIETLGTLEWKFLVCANQTSGPLEKMALGQPPWRWEETGPDASRGWAESAVLTMRHWPEGWPAPVTVIARRYRKEGEFVYRYSFLYTNLSPEDLPRKHVRKHGFASLLWQIYGTKQGRENTFKTLLTDMGQHHPPSGRLGASEAFAHLAAIAANTHTFIARRAVPEEDRGIRHWRLLRDYILIPGVLVMQAGRRLLVRLAGGGLPWERKRRFLLAQSALGGT